VTEREDLIISWLLVLSRSYTSTIDAHRGAKRVLKNKANSINKTYGKREDDGSRAYGYVSNPAKGDGGDMPKE